MNKNTVKKWICCVLAATGTVACAGTMSACETSHPKVEMTIEFNGKAYELEYKLYRKVAPATVNHFLTLADNGYYDGLCVHDYANDKLYTGGYKYEEENLVYQQYYDIVKDYEAFPYSVWLDNEKETPTYTLYGEFYGNSEFKVENGAKSQEFGSLTMYYEDVESEDNGVWVERHNGEGMARYAYDENCATSLFFISMSDETKTDSNYCTFATLDEDSVETLQSLRTAIEEYIADTYEDEDDPDEAFAPETTVEYTEVDPVLGEQEREEDYNVPQSAIVIKSVKVKKY